METRELAVAAPERVAASSSPGRAPDTATTEAQRAAALLRDVHPDSPFRSPSWRWRLARILRHDSPRWLRRLADDPVHQAVAFLKARDRSARQPERDDPSEKMADLTAACALFHEHPPHRRCEVEARILADEPRAEIACKCGLTTGAVAGYEALFFDVRHHLAQISYIQHVVIRTGPLLGSAVLTDATVLKMFAFFGGVHVLDAVLDALHRGPAAHDATFVASDVTARLIGLWRAVLALPVNTKTARGVLKLNNLLQEIDTTNNAGKIGPVIRAVTPTFGDWIACQDERLARSVVEPCHDYDDQSTGLPDEMSPSLSVERSDKTAGMATRAPGKDASCNVREFPAVPALGTRVAVG